MPAYSSSMNEKQKVWGEARDATDDMLQGLGEGHDLDVADSVTRRGIVLVGSCQSCGRQWKSVSPWVEIAAFYTGMAVQGTRPSRQGMIVPMGCACGKTTPLILDWDDVRKYVDMGVRSGCLDPSIYKARVG